MDMSVSVAAMALEIKSMDFQQAYSLAVTEKAMDQSQMAVQEIQEMMPQQIAIPKGEFIDVYA